MIRDFIRGKVASYWVNAYVDASIACYLLDYVQTSVLPDSDGPAQQRARYLIAHTPDDRPRERLVVRAYTERHLNGHADMILAGLLDRWLRLDIIEDPTPWSREHFTLQMMFFPWPHLYAGDFSHLHQYAREDGQIELTLPIPEIIREICAVQIANIAVNSQHRLTLRELMELAEFDDNPKLQRLREMAIRYRRPRMFLWSASRTQKMASRWDWLFMNTLKLRYSVR